MSLGLNELEIVGDIHDHANLACSIHKRTQKQMTVVESKRSPSFLFVCNSKIYLWSPIDDITSAVQRRSPGRQMRPIHVTGKP